MLLIQLFTLTLSVGSVLASHRMEKIRARTTAPSTHICPVSSYKPDFPKTQTGLNNLTTLSVPSGQSVIATAIGTGVQNYTCNGATFTSSGALAVLYDASCVSSLPIFPSLAALVLKAGGSKAESVLESCLNKTPVKLGNHYFETNPFTGKGLSPVFDFRSGVLSSDPDGYIIAAKTGDIAAPSDPTVNVDWLELKNGGQTTPVSSGDLASTVFRIDTAGGQPPTSCTGAVTTSIPYAASYIFYK